MIIITCMWSFTLVSNLNKSAYILGWLPLYIKISSKIKQKQNRVKFSPLFVVSFSGEVLPGKVYH